MTIASSTMRVAGVLTPGCGLLHLAPDPGSGRVTGHVEVEQAAAIVADQEEVWKVEGLDHEQVRSPDRLSVVGEEGTPAWTGRSGWPAPPVAADGAGADGDAELE